MKTIGLVGGIASGKSLVAKLFAERGAGMLDADRTGHEVLARDAEVRAALVARWGPTILAPDGSIDRAAIAACVFASDTASSAEAAHQEREFLESLLHPRIKARLSEKTAEFAAAGYPAVVLDAPLLLEVGWGPMCDLLVMVDAPREARLARAIERGWTSQEFARRESAQWPVEEKRRHAKVVIKNDGTLDDLQTAVRDVWQHHVMQSS
jgi:dephospho-CoA kinase